MIKTVHRHLKKQVKLSLLVIVLVVAFLAFSLLFNGLFKPSHANYIFTQEVDVRQDPAIKRVIEMTTQEGSVSRVEFPKTNDHAIDEALRDFVKKHQHAFFEVTSKNENRIKQQQPAHHHISFEWYVVDQNVASVVFYEHWNISNVAYHSNIETFLINFNSSTAVNSKHLINFKSMNQVTLKEKITNVITQEGLLLTPNESVQETLDDFLKDPNIIIDRHTIKLLLQDSKLKNNEGTYTAIELPFASVPAIMNPNLLALLPLPIIEKPTNPIPPKPNNPTYTNKIAFTFDDGPNANTKKVLAVLKKYNVKATFFVLGQQVAAYPDVARQIIAEGHDIGNHTYSHKDLVKASPELAKAEIDKTNNIVFETTGQTIKLFRPTYGRYNASVKSLTNLHFVLWNVDPLDWKVRVPKTIANNILTHTKGGSVILMHDIYSTSAEALDMVLGQLIDKGYDIVKVSELLGY